MSTVAASLPAESLQRWLASHRFPALMLSALAAFEVFLGLVLALPTGPGPLGAFAEEFKVWCFGWDPASRHYTPMYVGLMLGQPLVLGTLIAGVWWSPLRRWWSGGWRARLPWLGAGAAAVLALAGSFVALRADGAARGELPFPAEALRTSHPSPALVLEDQEGARVDLAALRGSVVVLTGVYTRCGHTCPLIVAQVERALEALDLPARGEVRVLMVTLDPERDDRAARLGMARRHDLSATTWHILGGPVAEVDAVLDRLEIARSGGAMPGVIDHANVFVVIDRAGRVAYRFSLGERQERWLGAALRLLVAERGGERGAP